MLLAAAVRVCFCYASSAVWPCGFGIASGFELAVEACTALGAWLLLSNAAKPTATTEQLMKAPLNK
jgi:hypothetical protein